MATYTRKEALERCLSIWKVLAKTGFSRKKEAYALLRLDPNADQNQCPACEFACDEERSLDCSKCPVWGDDVSKIRGTYRCEKNGVAWYDWCESYTAKEYKHNARRMVKIIQRRIVKLEKLN